MKRRSAHSNFGRGGTYKCHVCRRLTRATGAQALGSELCPECWELAGLDNEVNDNGLDLSLPDMHRLVEERDRLLAAAVKKGGDEARIKGCNDYLWSGA